MTRYRYKALGKGGVLQRGIIEAPSFLEFKKSLQDKSLSLISYSWDLKPFNTFWAITPHILKEFCVHLDQFENAGIPLKDSLEELSHIQENPKFKTTLLEIVKDVERGVLFSKSLEKHPFLFDHVFVGLISVGEKTGRLSLVLPHLIEHLKWVDQVQSQVSKALRYPLAMTFFLLFLIGFLMTTLVPELINFVKDFGGDLPFSTRLLISFSSFLSHSAVYLFGVLGSTLGFTLFFFKFHPRGPYWKNHFQESTPLIGPLRHKILIVRFCHIFAVMIMGGVDVLQALQTAQNSLGLGLFSQKLKEVEISVREGKSLSCAFEKVVVFPSVVVRMIRVGEQTGSLSHNLLHVKEYLDTSLKRQVDNMVSLMEPVMLLIAGSIIGWIVFSVFLPFYGVLAALDHY